MIKGTRKEIVGRYTAAFCVGLLLCGWLLKLSVGTNFTVLEKVFVGVITGIPLLWFTIWLGEDL